MIQEGRCPNCGSILHLDSAAEKGHCLFCDAVFPNATAFEIAASPQGVTFPNLPQPKYTGPSLTPKSGMATSSGQHGRQGQQADKKPQRKEPPPIYIPKEPKKFPEIKLSPKARRNVMLISLATLLLLAAIFVPLYVIRERVRTDLISRMPQIAPFSVDASQAVALYGNANASLLIAANSAVSEEDMVRLFRNFCLTRAEIMNIDKNNFKKTFHPVSVKLVTPEGGYIIAQPANEAVLEDGSAIEEIP